MDCFSKRKETNTEIQLTTLMANPETHDVGHDLYISPQQKHTEKMLFPIVD